MTTPPPPLPKPRLLAAGAASIASWILRWSPLPDWSTRRTSCRAREPVVVISPPTPSSSVAAQKLQATRARASSAAAVDAALLPGGALARFNNMLVPSPRRRWWWVDRKAWSSLSREPVHQPGRYICIYVYIIYMCSQARSTAGYILSYVASTCKRECMLARMGVRCSVTRVGAKLDTHRHWLVPDEWWHYSSSTVGREIHAHDVLDEDIHHFHGSANCWYIVPGLAAPRICKPSI